MLAIQGSQRYTVYRIITPLNIQKKRGVLNILVNRNYIRTRDNKSMLLWDFDYPLQKAIRDYIEKCSRDTAVLEVDIDLIT